MNLTRAELIRGVLALAASPVIARTPVSARTSNAITEIAPGVFVHKGVHALFSPENEGDIANCAFVVGNDAVAVIDTGGSAIVGRRLAEAVRSVTGKPIRYVINTHMHPDHVFGNAAFEDAATTFIGHQKLARALAARRDRYLARNEELLGDAAFAGTRIVLPGRGISEQTQLDLGDRVLTLEPQPTAHTDNDLTVFDEATGTLFLGDLLFAGHVPTIDGSLLGWIALLDKLKNRPAKRVVPGHGPASMDWPSSLADEMRYLGVLKNDIRSLIRDSKSLEQALISAGHSEKAAWLLFDDYHARNVTAAFAELEWE